MGLKNEEKDERGSDTTRKGCLLQSNSSLLKNKFECSVITYSQVLLESFKSGRSNPMIMR